MARIEWIVLSSSLNKSLLKIINTKIQFVSQLLFCSRELDDQQELMDNNANNTNSNTNLSTSFYITLSLKIVFFTSIQLMLAYLLGILDAALIGDAICIAIVIMGYAYEYLRKRNIYNNKAVTILEIERILNKRGIQVNYLEKNHLGFQYKLEGLYWNLRFDDASGMIALGFAYAMNDPAAADIAIKGGCQVMAEIKMVRFYLKQNGKDIYIYLTLEAFHDTSLGFEKELNKYLDSLVDAMKKHDAVCRKMLEEKAPEKRTPRVGYYSEITERVNAFNSTHPEATKEERMEFISSIR